MDEVAVFMGYSFVETTRMGYSSLKPLQGESVSSVIEGKDVFAINSTYCLWQVICFMSLPLVFINLKLKTLHTKRRYRYLGLHLYVKGYVVRLMADSVSVTVLS